ncbi:hypothetical protein BV898_16894 [Hypsibius exemplaris]|uniref:Uncharacterized protein n=1 Tax=Hypsibius exemplaris TaxID=2072580 RepID=A0A9X6NE24_HYPEX|nr:hypothetical protein BV898_16894 [Hypsibius exemplaris]
MPTLTDPFVGSAKCKLKSPAKPKGQVLDGSSGVESASTSSETTHSQETRATGKDSLNTSDLAKKTGKRGRLSESLVWNYFRFDTEKQTSLCLTCPKEITEF